jgi:hypothetical protein
MTCSIKIIWKVCAIVAIEQEYKCNLLAVPFLY